MDTVPEDKIMIVAFSYALRRQGYEPNPCNIRLATEVDRIESERGVEVIGSVFVQWEIGLALNEFFFEPDHEVGLNEDGTYLDSKGVWAEAKLELDRLGIKQVIVVAQPFLQGWYIKRIIRKDGFVVVKQRVRWIGFDNSPYNTQWWTKGPIRQAYYAARLVLSGTHGHDGKQDA